MLLILTACDDEPSHQDANQARQSAKVKKKAEVPAEIAEEPKVEKYVYNPIGKRDPFENPLKRNVEVSPESGIPLTPLQKYDLGQFRLIGVIVGKGEPRAMVVAPDGKSFILKKGIKIGKNDGSVIDITTDSVLVKEKYYDFAGEIRTSVQEIKLPKRGGA
jgi:type IV pilus assembly protein PilP